MRIKIEIPKLSTELKSMKRYSDKVQSQVERLVLKTAVDIQKDAKSVAPVLTGRLRNSIDVSGSIDRTYADVGTDVEYAKYVEAKKPFLEPSARKNADDFVNGMKQIIRDR